MSALRDVVGYWTIPDEEMAAMPEISRHDHPQVAPQEYECGCVAVTRVTDRDSRRGEEPFEMRLAVPCGTTGCEVTPHTKIGGRQRWRIY